MGADDLPGAHIPAQMTEGDTLIRGEPVQIAWLGTVTADAVAGRPADNVRTKVDGSHLAPTSLETTCSAERRQILSSYTASLLAGE